MSLESVNPYTKKIIQKYSATSGDELNTKLSLATTAFTKTRMLPLIARQELFVKTAEVLKKRRQELALLAVSEMGKTITSALAEVEKCEAAAHYFAKNLESINRDVSLSEDKFVKVLPLGCILAVMPWNFPYWQVFRAALAALSTGNTMVLKHASNVSGCALEIEKIFKDAGWPDGAFQTLLVPSEEVQFLIHDSRIAAVTLTGSEAAGRSVAKHAGQSLKKTVLELGGSDPFIVTAKADVTQAATMAAKSRMVNNGQSCIAAKRFIVEKSVSKVFLDQFILSLSKMKIGDPTLPDTEIGPLVNEKAYADLLKQLSRAKEEGCEVLLKPHLDPSRNLFGPAVIKVPKNKVNKGVFAEEFFGPVALYFEVENLDEAIKVANNSSFGLGSNFWSNSRDEIERAVTEIEAGMTFINSMVASEPLLPFGGIKNSGYGRELGTFGPHEFVNMKSIRRLNWN